MASRSRSARSVNAFALTLPSGKRAISSPPRRAGVSMARHTARILSATVCRSRSPVSWPMVSLTSLKSSRSRNSIPTCSRRRFADTNACSTLRRSTSRWGRAPLSGDAPYVDNGASTARAFRHEKRLRPRAHRNMLIQVERVVIVGRGGAGKSTAALRLSELTGLPVIELDKRFWRPDLTPTPRDEWIQMQRELIAPPQWIMDGDFGPHDVLAVRLERTDAVLILDFSFIRCAWRGQRRSRA